MRFKILLFVGFVSVSALGFGQDINRSKEWHIQRPEHSQSQVEKEMMANGTVASVGVDPKMLDQDGNPTTVRSDKQAGVTEAGQAGSSVATSRATDASAKSAFSIASETSDESSDASAVRHPFVIAIACLLAGLGIAMLFRKLTNMIKVPA